MKRTVHCLVVGLVVIALSFFAGAAADAQMGGGNNSGGTGTSGTGTSTTPKVVSAPTGTTMPGAGSAGMFLTGRVIVDDGSPLPQSITIQRVCSGSARTVAYVSGSGAFSFRLGQSDGTVMPDASESSSGNRSGPPSGVVGISRTSSGTNPFSLGQSSGPQMLGCELRATTVGYRSSSVMLGNRTAMDGPDLGSIVLHRLTGADGASVSATSLMAPKDAQKAYERGMIALSRNKPGDAEKEFEKAVTRYPKYAQAWVSLGKLRLSQNAVEPAREAFLKAAEADPKMVSPYVELGFLAAKEKKWDVAGQYLDRATKLDPIDFPDAWYADAVVNFNLKKYDAAEKSAREAMKLDPKHANPRAQYLLALSLIEKHDYPEAAIELKSYLKADPSAADFATVKDQSDRLDKFLEQSQPEAPPTGPATSTDAPALDSNKP